MSSTSLVLLVYFPYALVNTDIQYDTMKVFSVLSMICEGTPINTRIKGTLSDILQSPSRWSLLLISRLWLGYHISDIWTSDFHSDSLRASCCSFRWVPYGSWYPQ